MWYLYKENICQWGYQGVCLKEEVLPGVVLLVEITIYPWTSDHSSWKLVVVVDPDVLTSKTLRRNMSTPELTNDLPYGYTTPQWISTKRNATQRRTPSPSCGQIDQTYPSVVKKILQDPVSPAFQEWMQPSHHIYEKGSNSNLQRCNLIRIIKI